MAGMQNWILGTNSNAQEFVKSNKKLYLHVVGCTSIPGNNDGRGQLNSSTEDLIIICDTFYGRKMIEVWSGIIPELLTAKYGYPVCEIIESDFSFDWISDSCCVRFPFRFNEAKREIVRLFPGLLLSSPSGIFTKRIAIKWRSAQHPGTSAYKTPQIMTPYHCHCDENRKENSGFRRASARWERRYSGMSFHSIFSTWNIHTIFAHSLAPL